MTAPLPALADELSRCRLCAERFAATATRHSPRPVVWFAPGARLLIASQAPGMRAHNAARPFDDPSGVRLRAWLGLDDATFWDRSRVAIMPMAFCFPGYDAQGSDLPPPPICRHTWHDRLFAALGEVRLRLYIGGYSQRYHLGVKTGVTETVRNWRDHLPDAIPLPHPSWRNTAWLKRNPWFEDELLPVLADPCPRGDGMTETTPLDAAHAAMEAAPLDDAARLRFYERLADSELFLLLTKEAEGDRIEPEIFELGDASFVLVFDREERLSQFVGQAVPYAALSGRNVAAMLAGQGIGLAVNLEVAPSSILLPAQAVDWLSQTLGHGPQEAEAGIEEVTPPAVCPRC